MRALVVGASGFLGSHVTRRLRVVGVDVVTVGRRVPPGGGRHEALDLVADPVDAVASVLRSVAPDVVVNCAGATYGPVEVLAETNVTGVATLLAALAAAGTASRLVHLGSAAEYGRTPEGSSVAETAPARPVGVYGATKLGGTRLVEQARRYGADAVVLRVFNPVGVGASAESLPGRLLAEVRRACDDGGPIRLGPLDDVRDFVDARDVAGAVAAAATRPTLRSAVVNVGSGRGRPVRDLVEGLLVVSGCTSRVTEDAPGSDRSSGAPWQQADVTLAATELDWKPEHDLEDMVRACWESAP